MTGVLVYVIGPSGAGKDSVLRWARGHAPAGLLVHLARRTISRPPADPSEDHEPVTPDAFRQLVAAGAFALHWEANGLGYGIRHEELAALDRGGCVLVNGSRADLPQARRRYPELAVAFVNASPLVLRARLLARGRETAEQIEARLARSAQLPLAGAEVDVVIDNDGPLEQAGERLLRFVERRCVRTSG
jgi:ribose 1,5-bisphosphokinase